jgi:hypothetical protein
MAFLTPGCLILPLDIGHDRIVEDKVASLVKESWTNGALTGDESVFIVALIVNAPWISAAGPFE